MSEISTTDSLTKYIFCNNCRNETRHICKGEHHRDYPNVNPDGSLGFVERVGYRLWICAGCERGTLGECYIFDVTDENYEESMEEEFFPERTVLHIKEKSFKQLPSKLTTIYHETLRAFNNKQSVLCSIGIRTLLEGICADKNIKGGDLKTKIDNLTGILPQNIVTHLHSLRFIGNEAAHELTAPTTNELEMATEICEDLLNFLYELDYKASSLSSSRESRTSKARKNNDGASSLPGHS